MNTPYEPPKSTRAKIVFFLWRNMPRFLLLALVTLIIVLAFSIVDKKSALQAEQDAAIKQERPPVNTVVMATEPTTIADRLNLPGTIEPWTKLELAAEIAGTVEKLAVKEGDSVSKGDVLLQIDASDYRIALDRAEAAFRLAKADLERDKTVYDKGVIPTAELDARQTAMQTAKADFDNAKLQLDRCTITAPMDGIVRRLDAKVGMFLGVGDPVGQMLQIDKIKAVIGIPESDINAVRRLDKIDVTIQALDGKVVTGSRYFVSSSPESAAKLYRLELAIDNPGHEILPGMFVRADIVKQRNDNALAIPFYSIISRGNEQFVFVEKDGIVQKRPVKTGIMERWMVEVTTGLQAGDRVVVEGHRDVEDGRAVKVVKVITDPGAYSL